MQHGAIGQVRSDSPIQFGKGSVSIRRFRKLGTSVDNTKSVSRLAECVFGIRIIRRSISSDTSNTSSVDLIRAQKKW